MAMKPADAIVSKISSVEEDDGAKMQKISHKYDGILTEEGKVQCLGVADAVDYKGFPADKSKTGGWIPAALILVIEVCERLSTMGIAVNLITYFGGTMHRPSSTSANIVTDFMGTCFLLCLLGGFLADSFLGRYNTYAIFAIIQMLGSRVVCAFLMVGILIIPKPCSPLN